MKNLKNYGLTELNNSEIKEITGGDIGFFYWIGKAVLEGVEAGVELAYDTAEAASEAYTAYRNRWNQCQGGR